MRRFVGWWCSRARWFSRDADAFSATNDGDGEADGYAGFTSKDRYELEADHFAAGLLIPGFAATTLISDPQL